MKTNEALKETEPGMDNSETEEERLSLVPDSKTLKLQYQAFCPCLK